MKMLREAILWLAGILGMLLLMMRRRPSVEDVRTAVLKAEAERLRAFADAQRAKHDAELKVKVEAVEAERAKPVDSVAFANDLLKE